MKRALQYKMMILPETPEGTRLVGEWFHEDGTKFGATVLCKQRSLASFTQAMAYIDAKRIEWEQEDEKIIESA